MQIIAERDKVLGKILLFFSVLWIGLSVWLVFFSGWYGIALALGIVIFGVALYEVAFLPKTAIAKEDKCLIIYYAFRQKRIDASTIEYVNYNEIGEVRSREGGLFRTLYIFKNDIRRLTVTVKESDTLKHFCVWPVLNAKAVSTTINGIAEQIKEHGNHV
ncbi:MAG: hypothetical protein ACI4SH_06710 [Candidatus Scatosoma sp.]